MRTRALMLGIAIATLFQTACSREAGTGGSVGTGGSDGGPGADAGPAATTIHDLRMGVSQFPDGTMVKLENVVVIGRYESRANGNAWVQDRAGGAWSGIHLFCNYGGATPNCPQFTEDTWRSTISVGQVVSVTGRINHFTPNAAPAASQLEIDSPNLTQTGMTATSTLTTVTDLGQIAMGSTTAEQWKGVYVKLTGSFTVGNTMPPEFARSCTAGDAGAATRFVGFEMSTGAQTIALGLGFFDSVGWCLSDPCFACDAANQITNQTFTTVQGIVEPAYGGTPAAAFIQISPVVPADLAM